MTKTGANDYSIAWSAGTVFNYGPVTDTNFVINGVQPSTVSSIDATHTDATYSGGAATGRAWSMPGQPGWVTTIVPAGQSGTTV